MAKSLVLLGDDGLGFDLARTLERSGVWRSWLGESAYSAFISHLSSPSTWENFMSSSPTGAILSYSKSHIQLQLRVRALLYDKASATLFSCPDDVGASPSSLSGINPKYLQLHGDDVYFSLEDMAPPDAATANHYQSKVRTSRQVLGIKRKHDELPDLWYDRFFDSQKKHISHKFSCGNLDSSKRTPEGMSLYLKHLHTHKRSRQTFISADNSIPNNLSRGHSDVPKAENFIPEIMFPSNCVPDSAIPFRNAQAREKIDKNVELFGVLDSLPHLITPSPAMIERFGIRPEYLKVEFGRSKYRGKDRSESSGETLSEKQAISISQKVVACTLENAGFDSGAEVLFDVLPRFLGNHIFKLANTLKLLSDSYIKQHTSTELLKMFLKSTGFSNVGILSDYIKTSNKKVPHQNQPEVQPFQSQHQSQILQNQQQQRLMQSQMKTFNPQNLMYQQQQILQKQQQFMQQHMRRQQLSAAARNAGIMENDRSLLEVKTENMSDAQIDGNTNIMNRQLQFRRQQQQQQQQRQHQQQQQQQQQQMAALCNATNQTQNSHQFKQFSTVHSPQLQQQQQQQMVAIANATNQTQNSHQFKQFSTVHSPQLQTQASFNSRSQPVKVEGFQELMGGGGRESTSKHD